MGTLYKYRSLADDGRARVEQSIRESVMWFSRPRDFNDPFDCAIVPSMEGSTTERRKYWGTAVAFQLANAGHYALEPEFTIRVMRGEIDAFDEVMRRCESGQIDLTPKSLLKVLEDNIARDSTEERTRILEDHQTSIAELGVLSLGRNWDTILMWSHYADCHRGLCLEFSVDVDSTPFGSHILTSAEPVHYSPTYPEISIYADDMSWYRALLMTKSMDWAYEEEFRCVDPEGPGLKPFEPPSLTRVILGCQMSESDQDEVTKWCTECDSPVEVLQARSAPREYKLEVAKE